MRGAAPLSFSTVAAVLVVAVFPVGSSSSSHSKTASCGDGVSGGIGSPTSPSGGCLSLLSIAGALRGAAEGYASGCLPGPSPPEGNTTTPAAVAAPPSTALHALWINLDRRSDRRDAMRRTALPALEASFGHPPKGICVARIPAVDGRDLAPVQMHFAVSAGIRNLLHYKGGGGGGGGGAAGPVESGTTIAHDGAGKLLRFYPTVTRGVVGCALSHRKAWKHVVAAGIAAPVLILEDDIAWVSPVVAGVVRGVLARLSRKDWDVLYLSYHGCHDSAEAARGADLSGKVGTTKCGDVWYSGLFTYVVNGWRSAGRLLSLWPLQAQIDKHVALMCRDGHLICRRVSLGKCPTFTHLSETTLDSDVQTFALHTPAAGRSSGEDDEEDEE